MKKDNVEVKNFVLNRLSVVEYTHSYIFGIRKNKMLKACIVRNADEILPLITYCEQQASSHKSVWGVRMDGTVKNMELIESYADEVIDISTIAEFEREYAENGNRGSYNRGHIFEKWCAEVMGGTQNESMTAKCTECGDIVVNGEHFQCKLWNATVTTEPQVNRFFKEYMQKKQG